jgi:hypothetical protein
VDSDIAAASRTGMIDANQRLQLFMKALIIGWITILISSVSIGAIIYRFTWFQTHFGFLCDWGGSGGFFGFRYPASKAGVLLGAALVLLMGLIIVSRESHPSLAGFLVKGMVGLLILIPPMAIRDYRKHRKSIEKPPDSA